jgi:chondroitin 4-sulfotransferase 11
MNLELNLRCFWKFIKQSEERVENDLRNFVFVHIQKTAGKSIKAALGLKGGAYHRPASVMHDELGEATWQSSFKFAFVRNPWDRLVSAYFYRRQGGNGSLNDRKRSKLYPSSFDQFCERIDEFKSLPDELMFITQADWVSDGNSKIIVDFVGKVENIQSDFDLVCDELKRPRIALPYLNRSHHRSYRDVYSDRTKKIVCSAYQDDIDIFKYTF